MKLKSFRQVKRMTVSLDMQGDVRVLGQLAWRAGEHRAYFEYSPELQAKPLLVSPFHLPVRAGAQPANTQPFEGLHGLFNDSLPDGWGRLLLDRRMQKAGFDHHALTPLDRLAAVGNKGMGALSYVPDIEDDRKEGEPRDLDWFAEEIEKTQKQISTAEIDVLQGAQGGSAGARPKIMIGLRRADEMVVPDYGQGFDASYEQWMVKFPGGGDPQEIGAEEYAYALMAQAAGIEMAETRLIETSRKNRFFATKRFDRSGHGRRHVHTASGLLNADHRMASLSYEHLHRLTAMMTREHPQVLTMFGRMAFNVYARNRDDHAKNHAFLMDSAGSWRLAPAYDLTFSSGPGGEHNASIGGEGRNPTDQHMLTVAKGASIAASDARAELGKVRSAVDQWPIFAEEAGLSTGRARELDQILNGGRGRKP